MWLKLQDEVHFLFDSTLKCVCEIYKPIRLFFVLLLVLCIILQEQVKT